MLLRNRAYLIDWRFLPEPVLTGKDWVRHHANRLGGSAREASPLARLWFSTIRSGAIRRMQRAGVVFVHVPRTGGTAIARTLYGRNVPHLSIGYYRSLGNDALNALPSFAVVRDPLDRLRSAYRFLRAGGTTLMAASRHDPRRFRHSPSFEAFVETLAFDFGARGAYDALRLQSDFVTDGAGAVAVDRLFAFDDIVARAPTLHPWIDRAALTHINEAAHAPIRVPPATRALVETLYAEDFALFDQVRGARGGADELDAIVARAAG